VTLICERRSEQANRCAAEPASFALLRALLPCAPGIHSVIR